MISKFFKVLFGIIITLPFFQGILIMLFLFTGENTKFIDNPDYEFSSIYKVMLDLIVPTLCVILFVILVNLIYLYSSGKVPKKKRSLWSGLIVVGNIWAAPLFWFWYIWNDNTKLQEHDT